MSPRDPCGSRRPPTSDTIPQPWRSSDSRHELASQRRLPGRRRSLRSSNHEFHFGCCWQEGGRSDQTIAYDQDAGRSRPCFLVGKLRDDPWFLSRRFLLDDDCLLQTYTTQDSQWFAIRDYCSHRRRHGRASLRRRNPKWDCRSETSLPLRSLFHVEQVHESVVDSVPSHLSNETNQKSDNTFRRGCHLFWSDLDSILQSCAKRDIDSLEL
mmetsp:Transcript_45782/g.68118  ORF Transcript_45782/g.68118 Transcript_45782/m.68118 type:complete len:211 (+) Transcript_45782:398-1030(+)